MRVWILFLPWVCSEIHLGALTFREGDLIPVDDHVLVTLDYTEFKLLPGNLSRLRHHVADVQRQVDMISTVDFLEKIVNQLNVKMTKIVNCVDKSQSLLKVTSHREKRGLINALGHVSKYLFGTATEDDVNEVRQNVLDLAQVVDSNAKILQSTVEYNRKQTEFINVALKNLNEVRRNLTKSVGELHEIMYIDMFLNQVLSQVEELYFIIESHLNALIFSINDIVSVNLLSPVELGDILSQVQMKYNLLPLFVEDFLFDYYKVIKIWFDHGTVILEIPFSTMSRMDLYFMTPFPSLVNHTAVIWNHPEVYFAMSNKTLKSLVLYRDVLDFCKNLNYVYLCDVHVLLWDHTVEDYQCITQTILSSSSRYFTCNYTNFVSFSRTVFRRGEETYIFQPTELEGILKCDNDVSSIQMKGTTVVSSRCALRADGLHIERVRQHTLLFRKKVHLAQIKDFRAIIPPVLAKDLELLDLPKDDQVWFSNINHSHVLAGYGGVLIFIVVVVIIGMLYMCYRTNNGGLVPVRRITMQHVAAD